MQSSQKTLRIAIPLWDDLDSWIKTEEAEKMGYHSKAQFVTEAVRELLLKRKAGISKSKIEKKHEIDDRIERLDDLLIMIRGHKFSEGNPQVFLRKCRELYLTHLGYILENPQDSLSFLDFIALQHYRAEHDKSIAPFHITHSINELSKKDREIFESMIKR